jgi:transposase
MPRPYSVELRERVVRAHGSYRVVAEWFGLGEATVKRWVWLYRKAGSLEPRCRAGGTRSPITSAELEALVRLLGDANAGELTAAFNRGRRGRARVHVSSMKRALRRNGYVVKKNAAGRWRVCAPTS